MQDWRSLNDTVATFTEEEVLFAMEIENEREDRRPTFVRRLTQRLRQVKIDQALKEMGSVNQ